MTDNVLISTPACVYFAFIAAVFAEAASGRPVLNPDGRRPPPTNLPPQPASPLSSRPAGNLLES